MKIDKLGLSPRTRNSLVRAGVDTVRKLQSLSATELRIIRGLGPMGREEIRAKLEAYQQTNGDRIRDMLDVELAEVIDCPYGIDPDLCHGRGTCFDCTLEWLQRPAWEVAK